MCPPLVTFALVELLEHLRQALERLVHGLVVLLLLDVGGRLGRLFPHRLRAGRELAPRRGCAHEAREAIRPGRGRAKLRTPASGGLRTTVASTANARRARLGGAKRHEDAMPTNSWPASGSRNWPAANFACRDRGSCSWCFSRQKSMRHDCSKHAHENVAFARNGFLLHIISDPSGKQSKPTRWRSGTLNVRSQLPAATRSGRPVNLVARVGFLWMFNRRTLAHASSHHHVGAHRRPCVNRRLVAAIRSPPIYARRRLCGAGDHIARPNRTPAQGGADAGLHAERQAPGIAASATP